MTIYIVKTLLCAAVLFLIYVLLLEREKMLRFNRFYLLLSIVFSFTVSLITIKSQLPVVPVSEMIMLSTTASIASPTSDLQQIAVTAPIEKTNPLPNLLLLIYIAVTVFLLFRFIRNLSVLLAKVIRNKSVAYHGAQLVLTSDDAVPHSFLNYIFIDKEKYEKGTIEKEILQHELTHVNQKHSIDILMVELIMVFAWINPLLYLYRKAILLNHEYLADEAVINTYNDTQSYQLLLFSKASQASNLVLSSSFNYLITKKRLIMMTRKTSQRVAILKQIALIPLIAAIGFLFSTRVIAQDKPIQPVKQNLLEASKTDAPQSVVDEYHVILNKYNISTQNDPPNINTSIIEPTSVKTSSAQKLAKWSDACRISAKSITKTDRATMIHLYFQLSKRQQAHEFLRFYPKPEILTKLVPSKEQIESWKNAKIYGIWIGAAHRVKNSYLNKHSNTEFYHYALRKLDKDGARIMKYQVEVALMSKETFEKNRIYAVSRWKDNPEEIYDMFFMYRDKKPLADNDAGK